MGIRRFAFLAALALLPASAPADMHPLECLAARTTYSKDGLTTLETQDQTKYRVACRGLMIDSQGYPIIVKVATLRRGDGGGPPNAARRHAYDPDSTTDEASSEDADPPEPGERHAEGDRGFFIAPAVFGSKGIFGGAEEAGADEVAFGMIGYYRWSRYVQPLVRALVGGVTNASDDRVRGMSAIGLGIDGRLGPVGPGWLRAILKHVALGARLEGDLVLLWTQPKHTFVRGGLSVGLRLELGRHP